MNNEDKCTTLEAHTVTWKTHVAIRMSSQGYSTRQIAKRLAVHVDTVQKYLERNPPRLLEEED